MTVDDDADPAGALLATIDAAVTELLATDPTGRSITAHKHVLIRTQRRGSPGSLRRARR